MQPIPFDPAAYLPAVAGYYTDTEGNMLSMPFNSSTPIMYYNKTVFEKADAIGHTVDPTFALLQLSRGAAHGVP